MYNKSYIKQLTKFIIDLLSMPCFIDIYFYILKISKLAPTDHTKLPLQDYFFLDTRLQFILCLELKIITIGTHVYNSGT